MTRSCLYLLSIVLSGCIGVFLGRWSVQQRDFGVSNSTIAVPRVIREPVIQTKCVPLPFVSVTHHERIAYEPVACEHYNEVVAQSESVVERDEDAVCEQLTAVTEDYDNNQFTEYHQRIENVISILRTINHPLRPIRIIARLKLATLSLGGPMGNYVQHLAQALLRRYCDENGKLRCYSIDSIVEGDIQATIALLESELDREVPLYVPGNVDTFQIAVQKNTYNSILKESLATHLS